MKIFFGKTSVSFQVMDVIVPEVKAIVNFRHLTYVLTGPHVPEPLKPGHFLIGIRLLTLLQTRITVPHKNEHEIMKIRKYQKNILAQVWKRRKCSYR